MVELTVAAVFIGVLGAALVEVASEVALALRWIKQNQRGGG